MTRQVSMQRRHFQLIADVIRSIDESHRQVVAIKFANKLSETNTNFNWDRFMTACGVEDESED